MRLGKLKNSIAAHANSSGFTLVELLVVIGIIAVLLGILIPTLSRARAAANRVACLSNIRQLATGILMYCNDNNGWFPTCAYPADGIADIPIDDDWLHWESKRTLDDSAIAKYLGSGDQLKRVLRCPSDSFEGRKAMLAILPGQGPYLYSYNINEVVGRNDKAGTDRTKLVQWLSPSVKILLTETVEKYCTAPVWTYSAPLSRRHGVGRSRQTPNGVIALDGLMGISVSAAFMDGHADAVNEDFTNSVFQYQPGAQ